MRRVITTNGSSAVRAQSLASPRTETAAVKECGGATWAIREGDARDRLRDMAAGSVQCCVTSPPYYRLRDYGLAPSTWENGWEGCLGLEPTPDMFVAHCVSVFREVRRVLRDDGTLWLNIGDSYAGSWGAQSRGSSDNGTSMIEGAAKRGGSPLSGRQILAAPKGGSRTGAIRAAGVKPKDLYGVPWMLAFALRADGWWLRSEIVWAKPNPMPESVTDRPTSAHEQLFLLAKSARYFYDADAIREPHARLWDPDAPNGRTLAPCSDHTLQTGQPTGHIRQEKGIAPNPFGRNKRNVWEIATAPFPDAHFATFPPKLVEPCILAGSSPKACGECGAPWEQATERVRRFDGEPVENAGAWAAPDAPRRMNDGVGHYRWSTSSETIGWAPSCEHWDDSARCVILDPFAGSGTVGVVALRHGRSFIGIELSPVYAAMARQRIRDDAPLLNTPAEATA
jgi:DNA modification methylase